MDAGEAEDRVEAEDRRQWAFRERLMPSAGFWAVVPLLAAMTAVSLLPVSPVAAVVGAVVTVVLGVAALVVASPSIIVTVSELRAGPAHVPRRLLGRAEAFTGEQARQERGPRLDARAYLVVRGWVGPVVKVPLDDPADPTPYWLVSTRRPQELVAALSLPADSPAHGSGRPEA